jgi:tetratricopeptide (TPR) repeat protein
MARAQGQRRRSTVAPARKSARSAEDLMFFPKLRRRAKWVFLLLAIAFGIGFVAFGVGTGVSGTSIGDVLRDVIGSQSAGSDVEEAQKKALANPNDAEAQLAWANALQQEGRTRDAITALERYTTLRKDDTEGLQQLANLWGTVARRAQQEAALARQEADEASATQGLPQTDSPFLQEAGQNKIAQTLAAEANARADAAESEVQQAAIKQQEVYERLTTLLPEDPNLLLSLAFSAELARDYQAAIDAYREYLALDPNSSNAERVKARIKVLEQVVQNPLPQQSG